MAKLAKAAKAEKESQFGPEFIPITSEPVRNAYIKEKKNYGSNLKHVKDIATEATDLEKKYKDDKISPTGFFSKFTAPVQKAIGIVTNNESLNKKAAEREALNSELVELKTELERTLRGGGIMGPKILEYFDKENVYPTINDTAETRKKKLAKIQEKLNDFYEASDLSLKHRVQIDPSNLEQFKNYLSPEINTTGNGEQEEWITMISPSGREEEVYYEDVPALELKEFKRINR